MPAGVEWSFVDVDDESGFDPELNAAVLHSYEASGVKIADHHTESERFLAHLDKERQHGRRCPADWSWIVPPAAGSTTPVFHRTYEDFDASPNFRRHTGQLY